MTDPIETDPVELAATAARLADLARRDFDTLYTAREALTLGHVHAACAVSRAFAAAAEAVAYAASPTDDDRPQADDVTTPDLPPAGVPGPAPRTRVVLGPFDDQAEPPFDQCSAMIDAVHTRELAEVVECVLRVGHRTHHVGRLTSGHEIRWPEGALRFHVPTGAIEHPAPATFTECGATCPPLLSPERPTLTCGRIAGHPGEHQGVAGSRIVRWGGTEQTPPSHALTVGDVVRVPLAVQPDGVDRDTRAIVAALGGPTDPDKVRVRSPEGDPYETGNGWSAWVLGREARRLEGDDKGADR